MARSLYWKATVVLNILLCYALTGFGQSTSLKNNITYTCRAEQLGSVIQALSKQSGYEFIYSRDLVDISKTVSLTVKNKSIDEVLALIETQLDVSFKVSDRHIIVKNNPKSKAAELHVATVEVPALELSDSLLITSISRSLPVVAFESHAALLQDHLDKKISEVQKLLGARTPRNIPAHYISRINLNNGHRGWFAAVGASFGDGGAGVELQTGMPYLYAVFQPHVTSGNGFYGSYGVGNSFDLRGNFSFNTIYMYSSCTTAETEYPFRGRMLPTGPGIRTTQTVRTHQVKLMIQYAINKRFIVRAGPVLNYQNTLTDVVITPTTISPEESSGYGSITPTNIKVVNRNGQLVPTQNSTRSLDSWIGWDASILYRINFSERK